MQTGTIQPTREYSQNVRDLGFAIGTGIFLIILFAIIVGVAMNFITKTINQKIDGVKQEVKELSEKDDEKKNILIEIQTQIKTALNIIIKGQLNGDHKDGD